MTLTRTLGAVSAAGALTLTGCFATPQAQLDFSDTEPVRITSIRISGGSGDVAIRTSARTDTVIRRVVRYRGAEPERTYRIEGSVLSIDTRCGNDCGVSYDIEAPAGVSVTGGTTSGDVRLAGVKDVEIDVRSGDVTVDDASGAVHVETTSGNITASAVRGETRLKAASGDIEGRALAGAVVAEATSGTVELGLTRPAAVSAKATSGDVRVTVPRDRYQVRVRTGSGNEAVGVPNDPAATNVLDVSATSGDVTLEEA
jgi:Putative adhesin